MNSVRDVVHLILTDVAHIPKTRIQYRPHVLLITFSLLVFVVFYPNSYEATRCEESVLYLHRHCAQSRPQEQEKCLHLYINELERCCDVKTDCRSDVPSRVHALECKFEQCYYTVYRRGITYRTMIMLYIVVAGGALTFAQKPRRIQMDPPFNIPN